VKRADSPLIKGELSNDMGRIRGLSLGESLASLSNGHSTRLGRALSRGPIRAALTASLSHRGHTDGIIGRWSHTAESRANAGAFDALQVFPSNGGHHQTHDQCVFLIALFDGVGTTYPTMFHVVLGGIERPIFYF